MGKQVVYVFTHDSIFLGEDGPTHQPIETLWGLRLIPNVRVWRPADGPETAIAWAQALRHGSGPTALALSRQKLAQLPRPGGVDPDAIARGGYVLVGAPDRALTIVATGSEVGLAVAAAKLLSDGRRPTRVVSMPCVEAFLAQDEGWRDAVLAPDAPVVTLEAGRTIAWAAVTGTRRSLHLGIDHYGASAPAAELAKQFGFTPEAVVAAIGNWLDG
jgi:transketolase